MVLSAAGGGAAVVRCGPRRSAVPARPRPGMVRLLVPAWSGVPDEAVDPPDRSRTTPTPLTRRMRYLMLPVCPRERIGIPVAISQATGCPTSRLRGHRGPTCRGPPILQWRRVTATLRPKKTSLVMDVLAWPSWSAAALEEPGLVHPGGHGLAEDARGVSILQRLAWLAGEANASRSWQPPRHPLPRRGPCRGDRGRCRAGDRRSDAGAGPRRPAGPAGSVGVGGGVIDVLCGEHAAAGQESAVEFRVRRLCEVLAPGRTTSESPRLRLRGTGGYRLVAGPGDVARSDPQARRRRRLTRVSGGRGAWAADAAQEGLELWRGGLGVMRGSHTREDTT